MIGDEGFKAAVEIAKTTSKVIDAGEKGARYLAETFAEAVNALAGAAADSAKGFRMRNRASVAIKTQRHLQGLGLDINLLRIEDRAAVPLIESLSVESDDGLQEMWASYIANAADPHQSTIGITRIITDAIGKLEPEDKTVLDRLFLLDLAELRNTSLRLSSSDFHISEEALNFSLSRFVALGLFSRDNSGSVGFAAEKSHEMPCNVEIYTSIGWFQALPLLLMFKQSVTRVS
ncbi:DUF4393 domain-containing protein [Mesorhizobium sp. M0913]|uniref:Abi-alpha family protein n=1 Tax=Mesorhizobium sp. M0913 TaxID=2957026 RepID=UPI0033390984